MCLTHVRYAQLAPSPRFSNQNYSLVSYEKPPRKKCDRIISTMALCIKAVKKIIVRTVN